MRRNQRGIPGESSYVQVMRFMCLRKNGRLYKGYIKEGAKSQRTKGEVGSTVTFRLNDGKTEQY